MIALTGKVRCRKLETVFIQTVAAVSGRWPLGDGGDGVAPTEGGAISPGARLPITGPLYSRRVATTSGFGD